MQMTEQRITRNGLLVFVYIARNKEGKYARVGYAHNLAF